MISDLSIIPKKNKSYNFIYKSKLCILPYNTNKGLYILSNKEEKIYKLCNGTNSIFDIIKKNKEKIKVKEAICIVSNFYKNNILFNTNNLSIKSEKKISFWINITNACNLRCDYCYINKKKLVISKKIIKLLIKKAFSEYKENKYKEIIVRIAGGEPLLEFEKVKYLVESFINKNKNKSLKIRFILLSNGTLMNQEIIDFIKKYKISVCISLDGTEKYHNLQRKTIFKKNSYFLVDRTINLLEKNNIYFSTYTVITNKNIKNIPTLTKNLLKKRINFGFSFVKSKKLLNINNAIFYLKKTLKILEKNPPNFHMLNFLLDRVKLNSQLYSCGANLNYITVDCLGNLYNCPAKQDYPITTLFKNKSFNDVFFEGKTDVRFLKNLSIDKKNDCSDCIWKYFCTGGCSYLNNLIYNRFDYKSPYCKIFKTILPLLLKVEANRIIKEKTTD